jgi:multidrug efflux system outer membrane protein
LAQYQVVRSALFPQLQLNGSAVKERFPINLDFLPVNVSPITPNYNLEMNLSYELDFWGKIRNETAASYSQYLAQVENRRTVVLTLVGSVAQAYIYLRQLDAQLQLMKDIMASFKQSLDIATYRFEGGITSKIEVDQALSVYEESVAILEKLEMQVPQQENLLCVLLGEVPHNLKRGRTLDQFSLPKSTPIGQPQDILTRRPDIVAAENNLKAANANIGVARAAFFPQLSFAALFGFDNLQLKSLFAKKSQTWLIGGNLLQQVFTGGALIGQLNVAKAQKEELLFTYEQTILKALQEVNDALIGVQQSQKIFQADRREVAALKDYLTLSWERYYEGQTQYLTVLDAERKVLSAELDTVAAQADQFLEFVDLYKSLGGGWVLEADQKALSTP